MRTFTLMTILFILFSVPTLAQDKSKVQSVKNFYVGELSPAKSYYVKGSAVQEKLRLELMKSKHFEVVESSEAADAVLTGMVWEPIRQVGISSPGPIFSSILETDPLRWGKGALRLVDAKSNETIWSYEYKRGFNRNRAAGRIADIVVDKLVKDVKETSKAQIKKK
jgi:hypothetical protein